jgi:formylglycine-generating enzyme required for sulfatase activity
LYQPDNKEVEKRSWRDPGFPQRGSNPVVCVSWIAADAYALWLSRKTGKPYRLLSEAEWEYSARAGAATQYSYGDDEKGLCRHGNGVDQTVTKAFPKDSMLKMVATDCTDRHLYTAPAGSFAANAFGLHDMHGNAAEWVEDCWHDDYKDAPGDGSAWITIKCNRRVLRGGSWNDTSDSLRAAARDEGSANFRYVADTGFRVARTLFRP